MKFKIKKVGWVLLDWSRKFFFACVFATLVSFWSAKWELAQERAEARVKLKDNDCQLSAGRQPKSVKEKR